MLFSTLSHRTTASSLLQHAYFSHACGYQHTQRPLHIHDVFVPCILSAPLLIFSRSPLSTLPPTPPTGRRACSLGERAQARPQSRQQSGQSRCPRAAVLLCVRGGGKLVERRFFLIFFKYFCIGRKCRHSRSVILLNLRLVPFQLSLSTFELPLPHDCLLFIYYYCTHTTSYLIDSQGSLHFLITCTNYNAFPWPCTVVHLVRGQLRRALVRAAPFCEPVHHRGRYRG